MFNGAETIAQALQAMLAFYGCPQASPIAFGVDDLNNGSLALPNRHDEAH
jgi:hypothetical protein